MIQLLAFPVGFIIGATIQIVRVKSSSDGSILVAFIDSSKNTKQLSSISVPSKKPNPQKIARIVKLTDTMGNVWNAVTGQSSPMPIQAKMIALAQAAAEGTGYGQGWRMVGNIGSYQCGGKQTPTSYYDCIPHKDSRPNPNGGPNIEYTTTFRSYKDGPGPDGKSRPAFENGTFDFVKSITVKPFVALNELLSGNILDYCRKQYINHYFEGFNLSDEGLRAYAPSVSYLKSVGVPIRRPGETEDMVAGRIVFYAASMARNLPEIAGALNLDSVPIKISSDLIQPWKPKFQASPQKKTTISGIEEFVDYGDDEWRCKLGGF